VAFLAHFIGNNPTAGDTNGTLLSSATEVTPLSIPGDGTPIIFAVRCDSGKQITNPIIHLAGSGAGKLALAVYGGAFGAYGADLAYIGVISDKNLLFQVKANPAQNPGEDDPSVDLQILNGTITDIPAQATLSAPAITANSPTANDIRVVVGTPAVSNVGATIVYDVYFDGVLKEADVAQATLTAGKTYATIAAGTHSVYVVAKDVANALTAQANTVSGISVADPDISSMVGLYPSNFTT